MGLTLSTPSLVLVLQTSVWGLKRSEFNQEFSHSVCSYICWYICWYGRTYVPTGRDILLPIKNRLKPISLIFPVTRLNASIILSVAVIEFLVGISELGFAQLVYGDRHSSRAKKHTIFLSQVICDQKNGNLCYETAQNDSLLIQGV